MPSLLVNHAYSAAVTIGTLKIARRIEIDHVWPSIAINENSTAIRDTVFFLHRLSTVSRAQPQGRPRRGTANGNNSLSLNQFWQHSLEYNIEFLLRKNGWL